MMLGMNAVQQIKIDEYHARCARLIAQTFDRLRFARHVRIARDGRSLGELLQETRALRASAQKLRADSRRLTTVTRAREYLAWIGKLPG
jgi:hypothetical protein